MVKSSQTQNVSLRTKNYQHAFLERYTMWDIRFLRQLGYIKNIWDTKQRIKEKYLNTIASECYDGPMQQSKAYNSYPSNSSAWNTDPQQHGRPANALLCASSLQHSSERWAMTAQVQPSSGDFLPVAQEQQQCTAESLNHRKHSHPVQIHLATETMQKRVGRQPLLT